MADPTKMYLAGASDGWYATPDLLTEAERGASVDASLERAYKDGRSKQRSDPLSAIQLALSERERRKSKTRPPELDHRGGQGRSRPAATSGPPVLSEAVQRGESERDRARALLLGKKRENDARSETESVVTSSDYQRDLYNPVQTGWAQSARRGGGGGGGWMDRKQDRDRRQNTRWG